VLTAPAERIQHRVVDNSAVPPYTSGSYAYVHRDSSDTEGSTAEARCADLTLGSK
jgi:hypothetical protein